MAIQGKKNLNTLYLRKIKSRVAEIRARFLYSERTPVADVAMAETTKHLTVAEARRLRYRPVTGGQRWGSNWGTAWFRLRIAVPRSMRGETVALLFDLENGEGLIFRGGEPVQGLCWSRKEYLLFEKARGGERVELYVEAGANARLGAFVERAVRMPEIAVLNHAVWDAFWDLSALADMVDPELHKDWTGKPYDLPFDGDTLVARMVFALNEAVDLFDYRNPSREELRAQAARVRRRLKPVYDCRARDAAQTFAVMGHAHIDVAWKWPLAETVRKCGRTFANVLELMDHYDDFVFAQSQPQLYAYAAARYPSLYKRVREMVRRKRWIPTGCMWVEADCNLTGGESLVRQILFGTRFFKQEFGCRVETLWLPDVFGFSAALPQIMRRSGIKYFFTTKLALNQFTKFPAHSFFWEGLDGSRVLSHFMPGEEYSAELEPWLIRTAEHDYAEKDRCSLQLMPFGHGDGGGGPARAQMIGDPKLANLFDYYIHTYCVAKGTKPSSIQRFDEALRDFELFARTRHVGRISQVSRRIVDEWSVYMAERKKADRTRRCNLSFLRAALNALVESGLIHTSPILKWAMPKLVDPEIYPLELPELRTVLRIVAEHAPHILNIVTWMAHTGNRPSDARNLRWAHIDMKQRFVARPQIKTGRLATYPIDEAAYGVLLAEKKRNKPGPQGEVFTDLNGLPFSKNYVLRVFQQAIRAGGFTSRSVSLRDLRHTFAYHMVNSVGTPLPTVQVLLGHRDIQHTMRYVRPGDASQFLDRFAKSLDDE